MTDLNRDEALRMFDEGETVFLITTYQRPIAVRERMEIERGPEHYQMEREDVERIRTLEKRMRDYPQIKSLKEAKLLLGTENRYGIYQIIDGSPGREVVNYYDAFNTIHPQVLDDIHRAESMADFTIVFPHWGVEYTMEATAQEISFARQMTEAGADLVIGTHPHVIQPVEWVTADNGNCALCYYYLGNYTSALHGLRNAWGIVLTKEDLLSLAQDTFGEYLSME